MLAEIGSLHEIKILTIRVHRFAQKRPRPDNDDGADDETDPRVYPQPSLNHDDRARYRYSECERSVGRHVHEGGLDVQIVPAPGHEGLHLECRGVCAITGVETDWRAKGHKGRNGKNYKAPSVDRIDNNGNYVIGNLRIVMRIVNIMKHDLPDDMFIALCRQIAEHNMFR